MKRAIFHNLFAKFLKPSIFSVDILTSEPGATPINKDKRTASVPNFLHTSNGSIMVSGFDLLIFSPSLSNTRACKYTFSNGISTKAESDAPPKFGEKYTSRADYQSNENTSYQIFQELFLSHRT